MSSRVCMVDRLRKSLMKDLIRFGVNIQTSIIIMILLTVMTLSGVVNIFVTETVIYGIKTTIYRPPKSLVFYIER